MRSLIADLASDPIYRLVYERRTAAAKSILQAVDREERYQRVRFQLMAEIDHP